jgi:hypothetical protein
MGRYRIIRRIDVTPDRVYRAFTDPELIADWMHASGVADIAGSLDATGSRYTLIIKGPWRFRTEVVRAERHRLHETLHRGPLGAVAHMVATLEPTGAGTDLDLLTEYTVPFGRIGRWIDRRWIDREPRSSANREVDRLVELVSDPMTLRRSEGAVSA